MKRRQAIVAGLSSFGPLWPCGFTFSATPSTVISSVTMLVAASSELVCVTWQLILCPSSSGRITYVLLPVPQHEHSGFVPIGAPL